MSIESNPYFIPESVKHSFALEFVYAFLEKKITILSDYLREGVAGKFSFGPLSGYECMTKAEVIKNIEKCFRDFSSAENTVLTISTPADTFYKATEINVKYSSKILEGAIKQEENFIEDRFFLMMEKDEAGNLKIYNIGLQHLSSK